jgi:exonuclease III
MSANLKLLQLNIEGSKHIELVTPFLVAQPSDVVCLQELNEPDIAGFEAALGMKCFYAPMNIEPGGVVHGLGIFSKNFSTTRAVRYAGYLGKDTVMADYTTRKTSYYTKSFALASADIEKDGEVFHIANTHLPATHRAEITAYQREAMQGLVELLKKEGEFVLVGDFNASRGEEIFGMLAAQYKDNIPPEITTSIDGTIHRAGQLPYMVDGIFSTPGYIVKNVQGHTGISDHWAFTAEISKA